MNDNSGFAAVSRRDAIRLIAATPASGAVLALPGVASATIPASANGGARVLSHGSAAAVQDLARLSAAHFEPLVGESFTIGGDRAILTEVRRGLASGAPFRQQFALTFSGPRNSMPADMVTVSHPAIGRHDLHVAPVGGAELEICFS